MKEELTYIAGLSDEQVNGLLDSIKSERIKLAALFMADCGLRLNEAAKLTPANLVFDQNGQLSAIQGLRRSLWRSHPGTRTISLKWLRETGLISAQHEKEINEILSAHKTSFRVTPRAVELVIPELARFGFPFYATYLRDYFTFRALRHKVRLSVLWLVFDSSVLEYENILYSDELAQFQA
ncbi:MAG: hypothetical protein JRN53_05345 [Nitrososphaerota archaeon]|nr:hypothetical protein [Nitrososphaerota archaeon]